MNSPSATETAATAAGGRRTRNTPTARGDVVSVLTARRTHASVVLVHCECGQTHRHNGLGERKAPCGRKYRVIGATPTTVPLETHLRTIELKNAERDAAAGTCWDGGWAEGYEDCLRDRLEVAALALGQAA